MAGPLDYSPVRPPQQLSYGAPLVDFGNLGNLPMDYFKGTQIANTLAQQNAFRDTNGQPTYAQVLQKILQTQGVQGAEKALPFLWKQQFLSPQDLQSEPSQPIGPSTRGEQTAPGMAATPTSEPITKPGGSMYEGLPGWQPGERPVENDSATGPANLDPNRTQVAGPVPSPDTVPPRQPTNSREVADNQPASPRVPQQWAGREREYAQSLFDRAKKIRERSGRLEFAGVPVKAKEEQAKALEAEGTAVMNDLAAISKETSPAKLEFERAKAVQAQIIKESGDKYKGINAASSQYGETRQYVQLAQSILNDPRAYTGIGANKVLNWNRIKGLYGDQTAAALQEGLSKVTAQSTLATINLQKDQAMEAGSSSSRIFSAQVDLAMKAAAGLENTLTGNRLLTEVQRRTGEMFQDIAKEARNYRKAHGNVLDDGWDAHSTQYLKDHPLFTKAELANPTLLGAPQVPDAIAAKGPKAISDWSRAMDADVIRTHDGRYMHPPR